MFCCECVGVLLGAVKCSDGVMLRAGWRSVESSDGVLLRVCWCFVESVLVFC